MIYEKKININLNKFLYNITLKKQYIKKLNNIIFSLNNVKEKNYKNLNFLLVSNKKLIQSENLVTYIIDIMFTKTNTLLTISDSSGNLKFSYSAGLFNITGKSKAKRYLVLNNFLKNLESKLKFLKLKPLALHLKNVYFNRFWIIKKLKKKKFIKIVKNFNLYPYNGCRRKKVRRKKMRTKKMRVKKRRNGWVV
uniref:Ribosomal protein S11 n=1 Tax=Amicula sp. isolate GU52X-4 cfCalB7 TaxID=3003489 RepID=A0A9E8YZK9_9STRA|nr:ribosomal protein S11 [Amicula sp. isolate GU52X-4 cfCalB7]